MDEAPILGGGRVRKILSPYGVGGETVYNAEKDLKSINSYNMGEGTMLSVFFIRAFQDPS